MTATTLNPYSVDIAGRIQSYENLGDSWLVAVEKVATDLDLSVECIDHHYANALTFDYDAVERYESVWAKLESLLPFPGESGFVAVEILPFLVVALGFVLWMLT